jgi:hypothetical protein
MPLPDGPVTVYPSITDPAGNTTSGDSVRVTVDTQAPDKAVITKPASGAEVNSARPEFGGTGEAGSTVSVKDGRGNTLCSVIVPVSGEWGCAAASDLPEGSVRVYPVITDPAGNASVGDESSFVVDTQAPDKAVITKPVSGAEVNSATPEFGGTGEPGSTVSVKDDQGNMLCSVTVPVSGAWTCVPSMPLSDGPITVYPVITDSAGNSTPGDALTLTIDLDPPDKAVIVAPAPDSQISSSKPDFAGTGEPGATVTVMDDQGNTLCSATVANSGDWTCTPSMPLADGPIMVHPVITDPAGNSTLGDVSTVNIDTQAPEEPEIIHPSENGAVNTSTPQFDGDGEPGSTVSVKDAQGNELCTATVGPNGIWACAPTTLLPDGSVTVYPEITDPAGNQTDGPPKRVVVDTIAPQDPSVDASNGSRVSGKAPGEAGSSVTVLDKDGNPVPGCQNTAVQDDGTFSCKPSTPLADGDSITVSVTDPAGNTSGEVRILVAGLAIEIGSLALYAGEEQSVIGHNFHPYEEVSLVLHSAQAIHVGTMQADENGDVVFPAFAMPAAAEPGEHQATLTAESGAVAAHFQVLAAAITTGLPGVIDPETTTGVGMLAGSAALAMFLLLAGRRRDLEGLDDFPVR